MKKTVVLGVTSGIAAFKSVDLVKLLKQEGVDVHVIVTEKAKHIVSRSVLSKVSGNKVYTELFEKNFNYQKVLTERKVDHIALADMADVFVVAPATANIIAKIANGFADDFLTTTLLAVTKPVIICPSMNVNMWNNPVVKENLEKIKRMGYIIMKPASGMLACGYEGEGKLEDIIKIKNEILRQVKRSTKLKGKKIIITSGGTKEKIDEVRFITNRSSGKMGAALAEECYLQGAEVLLLRAKSAVKPRYVIKEKMFETSAELQALIKDHVIQFDAIFHAAAVSDFQVADPQQGKISSSDAFTLKMKPQVKIVDHIKHWSPRIKLFAFKATAGLNENEIVEITKKKLEDAQADAVIANDATAFENELNEVYIVNSRSKVKKITKDTKQKIAVSIIEYLMRD